MGRRKLGVVVTVLLLAALVGVAIYGIANIANTPQKAQGAGGSGVRQTATEALKDAAPMINSREWDQAIVVLTKAAEAYPQDQDVRLALARSYVGKKDWAKASDAFEAALALGPENANLHFEAGTSASAAGRLVEAERHYARAQTMDPKNHLNPLYLAMVQIKQGNDKQAMVSLVRTTFLNPDVAIAWGTMAELELRVNHTEMALQYIEKARKIEPEVVRWRLDEAKALVQSNEPRRALQLLIALPDNERYGLEVTKVVAEAMGMLRRAYFQVDGVWTKAIKYQQEHGAQDQVQALTAAHEAWLANHKPADFK